MTYTARQWQMTVKIGRKNPDYDPSATYSFRKHGAAPEPEWITDDTKIFYGDSSSSLRQVVSEWLIENKPTYFTSEKASCFYSDGTEYDEHDRRQPMPKGWYTKRYEEGYVFGGNHPIDFETALDAFLAKGMYLEKGPDHQDTPIVDGKLQLHLIKTLKREREEYQVNKYLDRGWYIVSVDKSGEPDSQSVYSVYVLGHPEANAL